MLKIVHGVANARSKNRTEGRSIARLIETDQLGSALYNATDVVYTLHLNFP